MMEQYSDMMSQELQDYSLWEQDYLGAVEMGMLSQGFSDSNEAAATENVFYAKDDVSTNNNQRNDAARKPKRRRLKGAAAAAQSTTFLKASISNFRSLVQQHTGYHNATRGPITLCFAAPAAAAAAPPSPHYYYS